MAKEQFKFNYKVITKCADRVSISLVKSNAQSFEDIAFVLNNEHYDFLVIDNKAFNKREIITVEVCDY